MPYILIGVAGLFALWGLLLAPWLFVPLFSAALLAGLFLLTNKMEKSTTRKIREYASKGKAVLIVISLAAAVYILFFAPPRESAYGDSTLARIVTKVAGSAPRTQPITQGVTSAEWNAFEAELQKQRGKVELIKSSMILYRASEAGSTGAERAAVDSARATLLGTLERGGSDSGMAVSSLFSDDALNKHCQSALEGLKRVEKSAVAIRNDGQKLQALTNSIATTQQKELRIESLFEVARRLRDALAAEIKRGLAPTQRFGFVYARDTQPHSLRAEYEVQLNVGAVDVETIDLTGLISAATEPASSSTKIEVRQDRQAWTAIDPAKPLYSASADAQALTVRRTVTMRDVEYSSLTGVWPTPIREIALWWPMRPKNSLTLNVRETGRVGTPPWPVEIELDSNTQQNVRIQVPKFSFFFATPAMKEERETDWDVLVPAADPLRVQDLALVPARVQVLPSPLSVAWIQDNKDFWFRENFIVAILSMLVGSLSVWKLLK